MAIPPLFPLYHVHLAAPTAFRKYSLNSLFKYSLLQSSLLPFLQSLSFCFSPRAFSHACIGLFPFQASHPSAIKNTIYTFSTNHSSTLSLPHSLTFSLSLLNFFTFSPHHFSYSFFEAPLTKNPARSQNLQKFNGF